MKSLDSLQGKRITKNQAEALERIFSQYDAIHHEVETYGIDELDMTDDSDSIVKYAEELYVAFDRATKKYC